MAIYRPPRPRWPAVLAAALAGVVVGFAAGALWARDEGPDAGAVVEEVRAALAGAAGLLEVAQVEYAESVAGRAVINDTEYRGARRALARSRMRYEGARRVLRSLAPALTARIDDAYDRLESLMAEPAPPASVDDLSGRLIELLTIAPEA